MRINIFKNIQPCLSTFRWLQPEVHNFLRFS